MRHKRLIKIKFINIHSNYQCHNNNKQKFIMRGLAFAICCRPSVSRLSVTLVRPTQAVQIFGNISTASGTLAIH